MLEMTPLEGTPLKVVLTAMVVVLGIFAWVLSPVLALGQVTQNRLADGLARRAKNQRKNAAGKPAG